MSFFLSFGRLKMLVLKRMMPSVVHVAYNARHPPNRLSCLPLPHPAQTPNRGKSGADFFSCNAGLCDGRKARYFLGDIIWRSCR